MLHSAVIEVRQHLCCANVFLKFNNLADLESLEIAVDETKVKLQNSKCTTELIVNKYFSILTETFSNFLIDKDNVSFRINIKEIPKIYENYEYDNRDSMQINLTERDEASVICSNCDSILANQQKYDKIREFPSGAIDLSEFFCHHGPDYKNILVPLRGDLFYGFLFIVLNIDIIEATIRKKENHIYCRRCLRYMGETMSNGRAAKLWSDAIRFSFKDKILEVIASDGKSEIHKLMLKAINETSLPSPEPLLKNMHFTKVLLKASFPNRKQQYLLIHILEKYLPVLINKANNENIYEFKQNKAFKILYRLATTNKGNDDKEANNWPPLLEYWQQDINILKMKISPYLFSDLIEELNRNIKILPEKYRMNNDFLLSYIFY